MRPVQTWFPCGCGTWCSLTLPVMVTRRFIMQKARRHCLKAAPTACRRMVSGSLSLLCSRCFSPFPHGTGSLSVSHEYLALRDGPRGFTQNSSCSALLRMLPGLEGVRIRDCHSLWCSFPMASSCLSSCQEGSPTTPMRPEPHWFGLLRVRSPLLAQSFVYFLFLRVLRCFSSPGSPPL